MFAYIVSGTQRTGTSMMMECVEKGGLEICWDESREKAIHLDMPGNPNARFYELEPPRQWFMPMSEFRGKCIKAMGATFLGRDGGPFKVIYMMRDRDEQRQSIKAACDQENTLETQEMLDKEFLGQIRSSDQVDSLTILDYDEVLKNPLKAFRSLQEDGWPIDPVKSASGVNPELKHY